MSKIQVIAISAALLASFGCGASGTSNSSTNTNGPVEIKLDPNNMPPGLSATPIPMPANGALPPGISVKPLEAEPGKKIPGIPTQEEIKQGVKIGKTPIPGIDPEAARKAMGYPSANFNAPPKGNLMMKNRRLGGKPQ